ncbi:MAG: DUF427 domain-containing protein [Acidimicrobiales bacterium]
MPDAAPHASRRHPVPAGELTYEPSGRWVRAVIGDTTVVDSRHAVLVWEPGLAVPSYAFPAADVRTDLLRPTAAGAGHVGAAEWYDLDLEGRRYERLAWSWAPPELAGQLTLDWFRRRDPGVEHWYEEDEEVFVHPRDPYKRVDAIQSNRHVQVRLGPRLLADSRRPVLVFETRLPVRYYLPPSDVDFSLLSESALSTRCPYKGIARYWSVRDEPAGTDIVWAYPDPLPTVAAIRDHLAFYNEVVDITVDGQELPQVVSEFSAMLASR